MKNIEIFEPAMCCSTGLCGVSVDPELLRISTVLNTLKERGIEVKRYNLTNAPMQFVTNHVVSEFVKLYDSDLAELRELERRIEHDKDDGIRTQEASKITLNDMFGTYIATKTKIKTSTRENYLYLWNKYIRPTPSFRRTSCARRPACFWVWTARRSTPRWRACRSRGGWSCASWPD